MTLPPDLASPWPPGTTDEGSTLSERLAQEMAERWRQGERPLAEHFLARHPELRAQPEAAVDLIYEEVCLRRQLGEGITDAELAGRFPQWRPQLQVLLQFHQLLEANLAAPPFPAPGESVGDFALLAELGRGPHSRVFLATQSSLGGRPVVVKVTPRDGREHLSLARLQHSHIVPRYAAQDEPTRDLRLLCMPYFGGTTLARLLEELAGKPISRRTGQDLLDGIDRGRGATLLAVPPRGAARDFLARASYVQAVCWVGACLAEALHYAHERGLVHLDVKPSNVLLAADAQPMLLDFHLARPPLSPGGPPPESLGGSRAYMSPEQQQAMAAVRKGEKVTAAVDGPSDQYSLGLLLYEALGGPVPLPPEGPPRLERCNGQASVGLADILHRTLRPRPADRYADAAALAADLRRHLSDLPLCGVSNRSWRERWRKWRRRRPHALRLVNMLLAVVLAATAVVTHLALSLSRQRDEARAHLEHGRQMRQGGQYGGAIEILRHGKSVAEGVPFSTELRLELDAELRQALLQESRSLLEEGRRLSEAGRPAEAAAALQRGLDRLRDLPERADLERILRGQLRLNERGAAARDLHELVDRLRFRYGDGSPASRKLWQGEEAHSQALWDRRVWLTRPDEPDLPPSLRQQVREDLLDLTVVASDLGTRWRGGRPAEQRALRVLAEAEELLGPSRVLCRQRQRHAERLGLTEVAREAARRGAELVPHTAWEHYALGRSLLQEGQLREAAAALREAVRLKPSGLWPNFYTGVCAYWRGRSKEAVAAFTACVALAPRSARCYANRGLAFAQLERPERALKDLDEALRLEPGLAAAALNRALLHLSAKRYDEAAADLRRALDSGVEPAPAHYSLALVHQARGDMSAACDCLQCALHHDPSHEGARALLQRLRPHS
jgi:serine/threonine protein kinase/Flp pilus assembly protein TadD